MFSRLIGIFHDLSIKRKLILIITATSSLALLLACAGFVLNDIMTFRRVTLENAGTLASIVGNNTVAALTFNDAAAANEVLGTLSSESHVMTAVLFKDGRPFARYTRAGLTDPPPSVAPTGEYARFEAGRLELARVVSAGAENLGVLYLATDLTALDQRLNRFYAIAAGLLFLATLAAYGLSSAFQRLVSKPLFDLVGITRRVSDEKNYSMRAPRHSRDEVGQLFDGFNDMLAQIQQRDAALRAAHDELERRVLERTRELQEQIIERTAVEEALQQQVTRISLLNQIANALSNRQDLDSIVQVVLAELEAQLPVDFGSVSLYDSRTEALHIAAARRRDDSQSGAARALAPEGQLGIALAGLDECRRGQQNYLPDTTSVQQPLPSRFAAAGLRSVIAVPLMVEHRLFGVLVVARASPAAFTSGESEFLRMLAEQVAVAGSQARLYTELQRAYTELRRSQRAMMQQERLRALGQMASGIAHDINNNLTPIVTFADMLLSQDPPLDDNTRLYLNHILTAGVDIGTIVSRLREFYRPRDTTDALVPIDVNALVHQVSELTRPRWRDMPQARGIVIGMKTELAPGTPIVDGNATELRESLTNLVLNAVDAMPTGGTLTCRTRVQPGYASDSRVDEVLIEVTDTGIGMDEETRQRCLEPFFSTKGKLGTGLGLAMVYGVVERHGGRIEIDSTPGVGTTMRLILPARSHLANAIANIPPPTRKVSLLRILCVDDEPMVRKVLHELFRRDNHDVTMADSAESGLKLFRQAASDRRPYAVVVTDLGMPHIDGRQFAQSIKRESPNTPVILLTGWGKIITADGELPPAVDMVMSKPPRLQDLRTVLDQLTHE